MSMHKFSSSSCGRCFYAKNTRSFKNDPCENKKRTNRSSIHTQKNLKTKHEKKTVQMAQDEETELALDWDCDEQVSWLRFTGSRSLHAALSLLFRSRLSSAHTPTHPSTSSWVMTYNARKGFVRKREFFATAVHNCAVASDVTIGNVTT